jgi:hypothetical protein
MNKEIDNLRTLTVNLSKLQVVKAEDNQLATYFARIKQYGSDTCIITPFTKPISKMKTKQ